MIIRYLSIVLGSIVFLFLIVKNVSEILYIKNPKMFDKVKAKRR